MDSMLPAAGNDGGWQEKAKAMIQALIMGLVYKCRKEGKVMSQRTIQEYLPLREVAKLYQQAVAEDWHDEAKLPLKNYLSTLAGFDMALINSPSDWAAEALNQHGYLIQQFTRMLSCSATPTATCLPPAPATSTCATWCTTTAFWSCLSPRSSSPPPRPPRWAA